MADVLPTLFTNEVITALEPLLGARDFKRHHQPLVEVHDLAEDEDLMLASWTRWPPNGRFDPRATVVSGDAISVWRTNGRGQPGYVNVMLGGTFARFEWRLRTVLGSAEFAYTLDAYIARYDSFDLPLYVQERRKPSI